MHLISPLAGGITIAANGFARLYRRGTSTRATWYNEFEASSADSSGADIPLDSNGSVIAYVNELVQVRVYDSMGELQRDFVAGDQAYAVEVISPAFTGTDYTTGQRAVSKPTTAGALFDLWLASAGATDWQGLYTGASKRLQDIFGAVYGMFFNVKSPEFGAKGDGTTDDTAAWQAAHDAAVAAGGGIVVAPPGVYLISSSIIWSTGVSLFCVDDVTLKTTTAHIIWIDIQGSLGVTGPTIFYGLATDSSVTNDGTNIFIRHASSDDVVFHSCRFGLSDKVVGNIISVFSCALAHIAVRDCEATMYTTFGSFVDDIRTLSGSFGERLTIAGCSVTLPFGGPNYSGHVVGTSGALLMLSGSRFLIARACVSSVIVQPRATVDSVIVSGCEFNGGNEGIFAIQLLANANVLVGDDNHFFGFAPVAGSIYLQPTAADILAEGSGRLTLQPFSRQSITDATPLAITDGVETFFIRSTYAVASPELIMPKLYFYGQRLTVVLWNNSGSAWGAGPLFTDLGGIGTTYDTVAAAVGVNDTKSVSVSFVAVNHNGTPYWVQDGGFSAPMSP